MRTSCFPDALGHLRAALHRDAIELVSPLVAYDTTGASKLAQYVSDMGQALPHGKFGGFHCLLGLSAAGRARWGPFPEILGDDLFTEAMIPVEKRQIIRSVTVITRPPLRFWSWVLVRTRWIRGERQLTKMGIKVVRTPGQAGSLLRLMLQRNTSMAALAYLSVKGLAEALSSVPTQRHNWYRDRR